MGIYKLLFTAAIVVLLFQSVIEIAELLFQKRAEKRKKHRDGGETEKGQNGNKDSKRTDYFPEDFQERYERIEMRLNCIVALLAIIGGGLFWGK